MPHKGKKDIFVGPEHKYYFKIFLSLYNHARAYIVKITACYASCNRQLSEKPKDFND